MTPTLTERIRNELMPQFGSTALCVRQWFTEDQYEVYLRLSRARKIAGVPTLTVDIANIEVYEEFRGRGVMRGIFREVEAFARAIGATHVCAEAVNNEFLPDVLPRWGYERSGIDYYLTL